MIKCRECNRLQPLGVSKAHLRKYHGISISVYLEKYPEANIEEIQVPVRILERPMCARKDCSNPVAERNLQYCSSFCANLSTASRRTFEGRDQTYRNENTINKHIKLQARKRDNNTCRRCGETPSGHNLHVHHLIPAKFFEVKEEAHYLDNLVTLCSNCHKIIELKGLKEVYKRAMLWEDMMSKNNTNFVPFKDFIKGVINSTT